MIITKLIGGLGNQMFQYAAGLALALEHDVPLRLDLRTLYTYQLHNGYQLNQIFNGDFRVARKLDYLCVLGGRALSSKQIEYEIDPSFLHTLPKKIVRQPTQNYWEKITQAGHNCYLSGYWQSEKYFHNAADAVRSAFTFREVPNGRNLVWWRQMQDTSSVSIHIRLGDYRTNSATANFHGVCSPQYYVRAIDFIRAHIPNPHFFVFSDEPELTRTILPKDFQCELISENSGIHSYRDMMLMAQCKHHVIANSTFSWWGAWLGQHTGQLVVAPSVWFAGSEEPVTDIYMPDWYRI